jgi:hypothetical protein
MGKPDKSFHLPDSFFREIQRRAHPYPTPPKEFDPLSATDAQLERYGLPSRPNPDTESDFHRFWSRLLGRPFRPIAIDFSKLARNFPKAISRVGRGGRRGLHLLESSRNWSGAYITPELSDKFVYVSGRWKVPAPSLPPVLPEGAAASDDYQSSTWIGIDGHRRYPMSSMPQIGTSQSFQLVGASQDIRTYAWWQWWSMDTSYPPHNRQVPPVPIVEIPVSVNDEIIAGLKVRSADEVQFFIKNQTTGLLTTFLVIAPGPILPLGSTAEWIVERPTIIGSDRLYPLPNYADVVFHDCFAQSAPSVGAPATIRRLDRPRLIRMFEVFPTPHRTSFVSFPRKLSKSSLKIFYRDASAPHSGGLLP